MFKIITVLIFWGIDQARNPNILFLAAENDALDIFVKHFETPQPQLIEGRLMGKKFSLEEWNKIIQHVKPNSKIGEYMSHHPSKPEEDSLSEKINYNVFFYNKKEGKIYFKNPQGTVKTFRIGHVDTYYNLDKDQTMENFDPSI